MEEEKINADWNTYILAIKNIGEILEKRDFTKKEIKQIVKETCIPEHLLKLAILHKGGKLL